MAEIQVSMTELRQGLGDLMNRAAYGGERVVLVSDGEPKAAIIGIDDLRRLREWSGPAGGDRTAFASALTAARIVQERIAAWQAAHGVTPEDSVETLRRLREDQYECSLSYVRIRMSP